MNVTRVYVHNRRVEIDENVVDKKCVDDVEEEAGPREGDSVVDDGVVGEVYGGARIVGIIVRYGYRYAI